jgi:hypothetical protein
MYCSSPNYIFRKQAIQALLQNHESNLPIDQFYESLFTSAVVAAAEAPRSRKTIVRPTLPKKKIEEKQAPSPVLVSTFSALTDQSPHMEKSSSRKNLKKPEKKSGKTSKEKKRQKTQRRD